MSSSQSREITTTTYSKLTSITRGSDFTEHIDFNTAVVEVDVFELVLFKFKNLFCGKVKSKFQGTIYNNC